MNDALKQEIIDKLDDALNDLGSSNFCGCNEGDLTGQWAEGLWILRAEFKKRLDEIIGV